MPYLLMQDQLRDFLRLPSATIVTLGYSFGDEHINEVLRYGLNANPRAIVFTLQYGSIECCGSLARLALENPSLMVAARDGAVIGGRQGAWQEGPDGSPTEFDLGDFARFGAHLRRLTTRRIDTIEPNAN